MATALDTDDKGIDNFFVEGIQISELEDRVMIPFKNRNGKGDNVGGGDTQNDQAQSLSAFDVYMHSGFESIFVSEDTFSVNSGDTQDDRAQSVLARHACTWVVTTSCFICSFGLLPFGEEYRRFTAAGQIMTKTYGEMERHVSRPIDCGLFFDNPFGSATTYGTMPTHSVIMIMECEIYEVSITWRRMREKSGDWSGSSHTWVFIGLKHWDAIYCDLPALPANGSVSTIEVTVYKYRCFVGYCRSATEVWSKYGRRWSEILLECNPDENGLEEESNDLTMNTGQQHRNSLYDSNVKKELEQKLNFEGSSIKQGTHRWLVDRIDDTAHTKHYITVYKIGNRFIPVVTRLLVLWFIFTNSEKNVLRLYWTRLNYLFGNASILILWQGGDMDRYPGPNRSAISDIARDFCKKMISVLAIQYWEAKEGRKLTQADYKKKPEGWAEDIWYGDPSTCTKKARNSMLKMFIGLCEVQEIAVPSHWLGFIEIYERLLEKQCSKADRAQYAKELQSWLHQKRAEETVDYLFDRLAKVSNEERNYTVRHMLERLTPYVPEMSMIIQSWKLVEDTVISQDETSTGHASDTGPSIDGSDTSETNTAEVNLQAGHTINSSEGSKQLQTVIQSLHVSEKPKLGETTEPADLLHDISDCVSDPLGGNDTYFMEYLTPNNQDDWSENQVRKRYVQEAGLDITPSPSKRLRSSTEQELLQSSQNKAPSNDSMDLMLNDLMDIIRPEIQDISLQDYSESNSVGDNAEKGTRFDGLQELCEYVFG